MVVSSSIYEQLIIYIGLLTCITGVLGGLLNIIVFLSYRTFRKNSCAFYLTMISFLNISELISGYFPRIMISGFHIDWTQSSLIYCKFRWFHVQLCLSIISTCLCLMTIDQFCATCLNHRWQQYSNIKIARRLCFLFTCLWLFHAIPYLIYQNHMITQSTNRTICAITNPIFYIYFVYCHVLILNGFLPIIITMIFGYLAYRNLQKLSFQTVPIIRRELDKQLTVIVLIHIILNCFTTVPYMIVIILLIMPNSDEKLMMTISNLLPLKTIVICLFYLNFSSPFYIYICVSERFRRQLKYILFDVYLVRWRQRITIVNEVAPQT